MISIFNKLEWLDKIYDISISIWFINDRKEDHMREMILLWFNSLYPSGEDYFLLFYT